LWGTCGRQVAKAVSGFARAAVAGLQSELNRALRRVDDRRSPDEALAPAPMVRPPGVCTTVILLALARFEKPACTAMAVAVRGVGLAPVPPLGVPPSVPVAGSRHRAALPDRAGSAQGDPAAAATGTTVVRRVAPAGAAPGVWFSFSRTPATPPAGTACMTAVADPESRSRSNENTLPWGAPTGDSRDGCSGAVPRTDDGAAGPAAVAAPVAATPGASAGRAAGS
jgi:hypothetical protein